MFAQAYLVSVYVSLIRINVDLFNEYPYIYIVSTPVYICYKGSPGKLNCYSVDNSFSLGFKAEISLGVGSCNYNKVEWK